MSSDLIKSYCFVIFFFCSLLCNSQDKSFTFRKLYEKSISLGRDTLSPTQQKKPNIVQLFTKETWKVSDLSYIDSLVASHETSESQLKGLSEYVAGNAYNEFDDDLKLKYYRQAYISFETQKDVEGMFFSLVQIFNSKIITANKSEPSQELNRSFKELEQLAEDTNYIPVTLALKESFLRKKLSLSAELSEDVVREISILAEQHKAKYSDLSRNLMTTIGIAYQRLGNSDKALEYKHKALELANPSTKDYPSFLVNVGGSHFYKRNVDSALYYLKKGYNEIPEKPKDVYSTSLKSTTAFNLGVLHKISKNIDSAYYFSTESNKYSKQLLSLKLKQNNLYADKKFEVQKAKLKVADTEIELQEERQLRDLIIIGFVFSVVILSFLIYIYYRTNRLKKEAIVEKNKRERLLQILNHDLGEPLQVFIDSSIIIPKLIAAKSYKELELIQHSLIDTLISLQSILKNLFSWNKKNSEEATEVISEININEQLEMILRSYESVAAMKDLTLDFQYNDEIIINANAFKLGNLLRNIIYNAVKHSPADKVVYIQTRINANKDIEFECLNTIKTTDIEYVKELTSHFNGIKSLNYSKTGLGLELIDDALKSIDAQIQAKLSEDTFKVKLTISQLS